MDPAVIYLDDLTNVASVDETVEHRGGDVLDVFSGRGFDHTAIISASNIYGSPDVSVGRFTLISPRAWWAEAVEAEHRGGDEGFWGVEAEGAAG